MSRPTPAGLLIGDVDDDDVGQFLVRNCPRDRGANRAGASNYCYFSIHLTIASGRTLHANAEC